jgi:hypothetical protein
LNVKRPAKDFAMERTGKARYSKAMPRFPGNADRQNNRATTAFKVGLPMLPVWEMA